MGSPVWQQRSRQLRVVCSEPDRKWCDDGLHSASGEVFRDIGNYHGNFGGRFEREHQFRSSLDQSGYDRQSWLHSGIAIPSAAGHDNQLECRRSERSDACRSGLAGMRKRVRLLHDQTGHVWN